MPKIYTARELRELHIGSEPDTPISDLAELEGGEKALVGLRFGARNAIAEHLSAMRSIVEGAEAEGRRLLASEQREYDRHQDELTKLNLLAQEVGATEDEKHPSRHMYDGNVRAGSGRASAGSGWLGTDEGESFVHYIRTGDHGEHRAQGVGTGSAGGYLVPEGFRRQLIERKKAFDAVRRVAQIVTTDSGNSLPWPTVDDTTNDGSILAENTQAVETDVLFGTEDLAAYKYTSDIVRFSVELLQDSDLDLVNFLQRTLGRRIARKQSAHFTVGTGTAQPEGIVTGATVGVTAASATAITLDELIDLEMSLDQAYLEAESGAFVGWMIGTAAFQSIRKIKDNDGNYIVQPSVQAGAPRQLLGYPLVVNPDMPDPAAAGKTVLFGNLTEGYVIRDVREGFLTVFKERYADYGQQAVLLLERADGTVQDPNAYRALQQAAA
jgi:HK97 family phage major capsid protein